MYFLCAQALCVQLLPAPTKGWMRVTHRAWASCDQISLVQNFGTVVTDIFGLLLQNFALLFGINRTEINQSQSSSVLRIL
jgi:hypothetical protein